VPKAKWGVHSHHFCQEWQGYPVTFCAAVWGIDVRVVDPDQGRGYGWMNEFWLTSYPRGTKVRSPLVTYRTYIERYVGAVPYNLRRSPKATGVKGVGRIGGDFWAVLRDGRGRLRGSIAGRYPESYWGQLNIAKSTAYLLAPGERGPVPTLHSEAYRENCQEIEARAFIEKALTGKGLRAKLGEDLAGRSQALLDERIRACNRAAGSWMWFLSSDWEKRTEKLFALAAEVAGKLKGK